MNRAVGIGAVSSRAANQRVGRMRESDGSGRNYQPIEPAHGVEELFRNGAAAGAKLHALFGIAGAVVVVAGVAGGLLAGTKCGSVAQAAVVVAVIVVAAIYLQRLKDEKHQKP